MLMMLPFEAPTIFEGINKSYFRMPRVVKDQRSKFENDDLFRQLSHESAVKYTGFKDRPLEERQMKFIANCQEGHTELSVVQSGNQFTLMFNPTANPAYNNEGCDFDKQLGKVHIKSGFILNGVCVVWRGWIDLQRLEGFGCLEFDEQRAMFEDAMVKHQLDKCNSGAPPSQQQAPPTAAHPHLNPLAHLGHLNSHFGHLAGHHAHQQQHQHQQPSSQPAVAAPPGSGSGRLPSSSPPHQHPMAGHLQQHQSATANGAPPVQPPPPTDYGSAAIAAAAAAAFHQALSVGAPGGHLSNPLMAALNGQHPHHAHPGLVQHPMVGPTNGAHQHALNQMHLMHSGSPPAGGLNYGGPPLPVVSRPPASSEGKRARSRSPVGRNDCSPPHTGASRRNSGGPLKRPPPNEQVDQHHQHQHQQHHQHLPHQHNHQFSSNRRHQQTRLSDELDVVSDIPATHADFSPARQMFKAEPITSGSHRRRA